MDGLITYLVYNGIILLPAFFVFLERSYIAKNLMYYLALFLVIVLVSIREQVGRDFNSYIYIYDGVKDNERLEFGFQSLVDFLNFFDLPSQSLFFFCALITYGLIFKVYKLTSSYIFLFVWFLIFFLPSLNQMRQLVSIAILTYSVIYLSNKKLFISLVLLATSFHYTGFIGFAFLIFSKIQLRFLWMILFFTPFLSFIKLSDLILSLGVFQESYYYFYLTDQAIYAGQQTLSIGGVIRLSLVFLFVYIYRNDKREFTNFIKNSLVAYAILYFLSLNFYILYRVYMPFMIALPFAAYYLFKENGIFIKCFVIFYMFCLFVFFQKNISEQTIRPGQGNAIYPYQTIFSEKIIKLD